MARRHFKRDLKPDFAALTKEIEVRLRARGVDLGEIFVVGSYRDQLNAAFEATGESEVNTLVNVIEKTAGDIDILIRCRGENLDLAAIKEWLDVELNDSAWIAGAREKDFSIDLWLTDQPILPRTARPIQIYPNCIFD